MCGGSKTFLAIIKKCETVIILSSTPRDSTHHTMAIKFVWGQIYIFLKVHTTLLLNALFVELMLCYIRRGISGNICTFYERWKWWHPRLAMEGEHHNRIGPPKWRNTQVYITSVKKIFLTLKISEEIL